MVKAANSGGNLKEAAHSNFYKQIPFRKGRTSAISATASKLAIIIWEMVTKEIPYKKRHAIGVLRSEKAAQRHGNEKANS